MQEIAEMYRIFCSSKLKMRLARSTLEIWAQQLQFDGGFLCIVNGPDMHSLLICTLHREESGQDSCQGEVIDLRS
jgi:hypothetical protein